jgi:siderophore synthetase component
MTTTAPPAATAAPAATARADAAAVTTLLNCWLRETGAEVGRDGRLRLELLGLELLAPLAYRSPTGQHRWRLPVRLAGSTSAPVPLDHVTLAALLGKELGLSATHPGAALGDFVAGVVESTANVTSFLGDEPRPGAGPETPFIAAEQSLAFGHPLHPTAKSRPQLRADEVASYSPELGAAFPLHWFRADRSIVAEDGAVPGAGSATAALAGLLATGPEVDAAVARAAGADGGGSAFVPVHPWQARRLLERPAVRELLAAGLLADLGPQGGRWRPTSSLRTVYRADVPFMLKLSLWVRVTNSVRGNLAKELARGVEVHRLLEAGLGAELAERFPHFAIVRDPAWVTVRAGAGAESGFEVVLRDNPYPAADATDATVVAALCAEPRGGGPSRLAGIVTELARAGGRPTDETAREWLRRYLRTVAAPLLWLEAERGVALEAHQQNVVLELRDGWPAGCRYRDNQGYYFKASRTHALRELLPELNRDSDTVCDDHVADERFTYYLGINNLLGVVGALGAAGLADERDLLVDLAGELRSAPRSALARNLLGAARLRCKANLRTRLAGMDELVGPLATQSVYVEIDNPVLSTGGVTLGSAWQSGASVGASLLSPPDPPLVSP